MSRSGLVRVPPNASHDDVEYRVDAELADDHDCMVAGTTLRQFGDLLEYANAEGLEIRDPVGYCLRYELFSRIAAGPIRRRRAEHWPWCVEVLRASAATSVAVIQEWGPRREGRRIVFARSHTAGSELSDGRPGLVVKSAQ